jgi:hypothetical protein
MAPEQAGGKKREIGPATDVYALGAILYELLTGRPPFKAEMPLDTLLQVMSEEPVPPRRLSAAVPCDLETICLKCLRKEQAQRYASAEELADDLRRYLAGEPIRARAMTRWERTVRCFKHRRGVALVLAGALTALLLFAAIRVASQFLAEPTFSNINSPPLTPQPLPADLDLVPRDAFGFLSIRPADLWTSEAFRGLLRELVVQFPEGAAEINRWRAEAEKEFAFAPRPSFSTGVERGTMVLLEPEWPPGPTGLMILTTARPFSQTKLQTTLLTPHKFEAREHKGRTYYVQLGKKGMALWRVNERTFVVSFSMGAADVQLQEYFDRLPAPNSAGPLRPALDLAAQNQTLVIGLNPDRATAARWVDFLAPQSAPARPLAEMQSVAVALDAASPRFELRLTFADEVRARQGRQAAEEVREPVRSILKEFVFRKQPPSMESWGLDGPSGILVAFLFNELAQQLPAAELKQQDREVHLSLPLQTDLRAGHQAELRRRLKDLAARTYSVNNLKQLVIALHSYEQVYGRLPPAVITAKDGKPLYSWRVAILPFVEEDALHRQFNLDEPWDSPHNIKLLEKMPPVFTPIRGPMKEPGKTYYQTFVGNGAAFDPPKAIRLPHFNDGTSNTFLVVEAGEAVPWTKPVDLSYDPKQPLPKLGGLFPNGFHAAFADGSVFFVPQGLKEQSLRAYITRGAEDRPDPADDQKVRGPKR